MSDLISREKLKEIINPMVGIFEDDGSFWWSREDVLSVIDSELVEVNEPTKGRWIDTNMTCYGAKVYKCSVCDNEIDEMPTEMGEPIWNYCPNCGAKMEG